MGRGKIEIKRIEKQSSRQTTFSKRRAGIFKKAEEITVLCDAKVSLIIFASSGKMYEYCSSSTTVVDMLDKYHQLSGRRLWDAKHENLSNEIDRVKKENDNMQIELRHLKGEDITSLKHHELIGLESALDNGLSGVRDKLMEYHDMMQETEKKLEDEHRELRLLLQQQEIAMEEQLMMKEMENPYHQQRVRYYNSQMPSAAFRVQPIQPNLQDRM